MRRVASAMTPETAQTIAAQALGFLAAEPDRLGRFLAETGLAPTALRAVAGEPSFLRGVLEHLMADEPALLDFARQHGFPPESVTRAAAVLGAAAWERDTA